MLLVSVLGKLAVLHQGANIPLPQSKKARALLAYLAVTARPHSRDRLCAMFWPLPHDPRAALRWSLSHLRPLIDGPDCPTIIADRENVGLDLDRVTVDIRSLRKLARNDTDSISTDALRQMTEALEGEFLEGFDLADCDEFQSWCAGEREETRRLRVRLLTELVTRLEETPDEALSHARALSLLEPANEAAQATLIRLLRAAGRWREAKEQLQRAQRRLNELNAVRTGALYQADSIAPGPLTQRLRAPTDLHAVQFRGTSDDVEGAYARAGDSSPAASPDMFKKPSRHVLCASDRPGIAVLPFVNMSGEPGQEYFSDGISEDVITAISKLRWFFVIARNSSFAYKGKSVPMKQIAEELGVRYLVEGSVRKYGARIRITAQLGDVATGSQLWGERYDRSLADVFAVQDEITEAIVAAIEPQIYAAENFRAHRKPPESLDAWDLVMRALSHYWRITRDDNVAAQGLLEKAIAIDPNYAQALALLAWSHTFGVHMGWENLAIAVQASERAALAAIRADSDDPWAHFAVAWFHWHLRRFDDAVAEFEAALRLNPNFTLALGSYGLVLCWLGRWQEGTDAARRALQRSPRDPLSAIYSCIAAYCEFAGRNYHEAMRLARGSIRERLDFATAHRVLVAAAAMAGDIDAAKTALEELRRVQPNISLGWITSHPFVLDSDREHYLEAFRRAGLD